MHIFYLLRLPPPRVLLIGREAFEGGAASSRHCVQHVCFSPV